MFFLIGAAGSGKSTVGKFVASRFHYCYLDKDVIANRFTGLLLQLKGYRPAEREQCKFYKNEVMDLEYETLLDIAGENLRLGNSVVLDAPFLSYFDDPDFVTNSMNEFGWGKGIRPTILEVFVQPEILKQRIVRRNNARDLWKLDHWEHFISGIGDNKCSWQGCDHIRFDNSPARFDETSLLARLTGLS
ncbi:MAG: ATP-binding protein [Candidatus Accumulibacter sp.]|nr:ATP-binding protein [Accumulibacter sp.]